MPWIDPLCECEILSHMVISLHQYLRFHQFFTGLSSTWFYISVDKKHMIQNQEMRSDSHSSLSKQSCDYNEFSIYISYIKGSIIRYSINFELSFTQSVHIVQRHGYWTSIEALSKLTFSTSAFFRWWFQLFKH